MNFDRYKERILRHAGLLIGIILGMLSGLHLFGMAIGALLGYFADELFFTKKILKRGTILVENPAVGLLDDRWTRIVTTVAMAYGVAAAEKERTIGTGERKLLESQIARELGSEGREAGLVGQLIERIFRLPSIELSKLTVVYKASSTEDERLELLGLLIRVAAGGEHGRVAAGQNDILKRLSVDLDVKAEVYNRLRSSATHIDTEAYEIIGLSPEVSDQEVHRVYRKLASQFHPDTGKDLDEEQKLQAQEAFLRIQDAYDRIIADRNALRPNNGEEGTSD